MAELELGTKGDPEWRYNINTNDNLEIIDDAGDVVATIKQDNSISIDKASITHTAAKVSNQNQSTSIPSGSDTKLEWDNQIKEDSEVVSVNLSNDEITVLEPGDYLVVIYYRYASDSNWSTADNIRTNVYVNGSFEGGYRPQLKTGTGEQSFDATLHVEDLSANDTIDMRTNQESGNTQAISESGSHMVWSLIRVA